MSYSLVPIIFSLALTFDASPPFAGFHGKQTNTSMVRCVWMNARANMKHYKNKYFISKYKFRNSLTNFWYFTSTLQGKWLVVVVSMRTSLLSGGTICRCLSPFSCWRREEGEGIHCCWYIKIIIKSPHPLLSGSLSLRLLSN